MRFAGLRRLGGLAIALGLLGSLALTPALAASIVVNSVVDTVADDGACTLREAITAANSDSASGVTPGECAAGSGTDAIAFGAGGTILLGSALPAISSNLSIDGGGAVTVSGGSAVRVFDVSAGTVSFSNIVITAGSAAVTGGAVRNLGALAISNSTITNSTANLGGGIHNDGTLTITQSTITGNSVGNLGAGIFNQGTLTLSQSTVRGNTGPRGGGLTNSGTLTISNSTIAGNSALTSIGGGIENAGTLTITNTTVSGNTAAAQGGGIFAGGTETVVNSIVAGNTAPIGPDIANVAETITTSVIGVPGGMTLADILDPAGLADNGGPTQTIALSLVAGNPAIDAGSSAVCAAAPVNGLDQRGMPRPAACDIGAYEAQPPTVAAHANVSVAATSAAGAVVTYAAPAGTDEQGGTAAVACLPASGSTFVVGTTTVTCTATDAVGHTGAGTFQVTVGPFAAATATPTPSPTPTPSLSALPNTAAGDSRGAGGVATLLLGLLGVVSLAAQAHATVRARPKR